MIYLLPFLNAFFLYVCLEPKQLFYKPYTWIMENVAVHLPGYIIKILGACILCTATWMGIAELGIWFIIKPEIITILSLKYVLIIAYNAVSTCIIYKFLQ